MSRTLLQGTSYERMCMLLLQSYLTLCDPMDCSPPGSSIHEILQARILEGVDMPFSRLSSWPRDRMHTLASMFFTTSTTWEDICKKKTFWQSCKLVYLKFGFVLKFTEVTINNLQCRSCWDLEVYHQTLCLPPLPWGTWNHKTRCSDGPLK